MSKYLDKEGLAYYHDRMSKGTVNITQSAHQTIDVYSDYTSYTIVRVVRYHGSDEWVLVDDFGQNYDTSSPVTEWFDMKYAYVLNVRLRPDAGYKVGRLVIEGAMPYVDGYQDSQEYEDSIINNNYQTKGIVWCPGDVINISATPAEEIPPITFNLKTNITTAPSSLTTKDLVTKMKRCNVEHTLTREYNYNNIKLGGTSPTSVLENGNSSPDQYEEISGFIPHGGGDGSSYQFTFKVNNPSSLSITFVRQEINPEKIIVSDTSSSKTVRFGYNFSLIINGNTYDLTPSGYTLQDGVVLGQTFTVQRESNDSQVTITGNTTASTTFSFVLTNEMRSQIKESNEFLLIVSEYLLEE